MLLSGNRQTILTPSKTLLSVIAGTMIVAFLSASAPNVLIIPVLTVVIIIGLLVVYNYIWGFYLLIVLGVFMFYIQRTAPTNFPLGVVYDFTIVLLCLLMLASKSKYEDWSLLLNPVTWGLLVLLVYQLAEVFNPMGTVTAWAVSLRKNVSLILYILCMQVLLLPGGLRKLTNLWIWMGVIVALYGIYQEFFGLSDAEWKWIYSDPERFKIYFVWGYMRKFSFLSDPSSYGIYMAFTGLGCMVFAFREKQHGRKAFMALLAVVIFVAMSFSGTRTAYAMAGIGLGFYCLLTIRSPRTLGITVAIASIGVVLFFGPFYGWQINRIRSAFNPTEDASMGVRDQKRLYYQPFVQQNPMGGGVYTTAYYGVMYAPGHEFAGFDPDSGYLETAMESGWIGLWLLLGFVFVVVSRGVDHYFSIRDPLLKTYVLAYLIPFFALSVAHFAQNAMYAKPVDFMVIVTLAFITQAPLLDGRVLHTEPENEIKQNEKR